MAAVVVEEATAAARAAEETAAEETEEEEMAVVRSTQGDVTFLALYPRMSPAISPQNIHCRG
jgi:hypothetical protein